MLNRDIIELVDVGTTGTNELGDPVAARTFLQVFADKLAINEREFYQSNAQGLSPEFKFKIRYVEYSGQRQIRYPVTTGKLYDVIRTYSKGDEFIELTCMGVLVNGNA